jgi:glycosyltransferase involved in cell wall biosynthesis
MNQFKITHLTSAHPRYDSRILLKECVSLSKLESYSVSLIVADGLGDEWYDEVMIYDVGQLSGRLNRIFKTTQKVFKKAQELNSDIYHFHDPELIPVGLKLKKMGKKVIFDVHEDVPKQILAKPYATIFLRKMMSWAYALYENYAARKFDYIITPTPIINARFIQWNRSKEVRNYPILKEFNSTINWEDRVSVMCHIGSLARTRGIVELIKVVELSGIPLELGGNFRPASLEDEVKDMPGWSNVHFHGFLSREGVRSVVSQAKIGMVTLHPTQSYLEAYPVKLFEYMAAGLAIVASDFPLYRELLKDYPCAYFVDPLEPEQIASTVKNFMANEDQMKTMGKIAKDAANAIFNWDVEVKNLYQVYAELHA